MAKPSIRPGHVKVAVLESAATWAVRRTFESAYHVATGREPPTARDRDVPLGQILAWAAATAAAVAVANVAVDRFALRHEPPVALSADIRSGPE